MLNLTLNYLHFRSDDLVGDDCIGDGKLTATLNNRIGEIIKALDSWAKFKERI
jgi:hypothetical protein